MWLKGSESVVRLLRMPMDGEISPESDLLSRDIAVTFPESQVIPEKSQGEEDSVSFHESRKFKGSLSCLFNSRRASVSTGRGIHGGKSREMNNAVKTGSKCKEGSEILAIGGRRAGAKGSMGDGENL